MTTARYRITQLRIEGFRGFTTAQTLDLDGKNLFIFGPNGRGKSSVVEAIRWCLFGAPVGTDIEVRNTFYDKQECRVSLVLEGTTSKLNVQRELRPGHDRSRLTIRDAMGDELLARDVLPQLTRLSAHESTQVIFAAQHAAGRQVSADISTLETVLCAYLHLQDVPDLLKELDKLHEERLEEAEGLARRIEQLEQHYRENLRDVQSQIRTILVNPPWSESTSPTGPETELRIREFVDESSSPLCGGSIGYQPCSLVAAG